jgi:hypothetical protein
MGVDVEIIVASPLPVARLNEAAKLLNQLWSSFGGSYPLHELQRPSAQPSASWTFQLAPGQNLEDVLGSDYNWLTLNGPESWSMTAERNGIWRFQPWPRWRMFLFEPFAFKRLESFVQQVVRAFNSPCGLICPDNALPTSSLVEEAYCAKSILEVRSLALQKFAERRIFEPREEPGDAGLRGYSEDDTDWFYLFDNEDYIF